MKLLYCEGQDWIYLGYRLILGKPERAVLAVLSRAPGRGFDTYALCAASGVGRGNVSITVRKINEAAARIGGRRLILSDRVCGYRLSEFL